MVRYQHESIIKEQREEIINARENLRVKNKELRNVRALSQVVLDQRSEVEQFFLEALEQIKEEIRKKNTLEKKQKKNEQLFSLFLHPTQRVFCSTLNLCSHNFFDSTT